MLTPNRLFLVQAGALLCTQPFDLQPLTWQLRINFSAAFRMVLLLMFYSVLSIGNLRSNLSLAVVTSLGCASTPGEAASVLERLRPKPT